MKADIVEYLKQNINHCHKSDLAHYLDVKENKYKKTELVEMILKEVSTLKKLKEFFSLFKNELAMAGNNVGNMLNITKHERKVFTQEGYLPLLYSEKQYISEYKNEVTISYYDAWEILHIDSNKIESFKKKHQKLISENRKEQLRKKKTNMPDWIKNAKITWLDEIPENIKKKAVVAKLSNEEEILKTKFYFGNVLFCMSIDANMIATCEMLLFKDDYSFNNFQLSSKEFITNVVCDFNFCYENSLTFKVINGDVKYITSSFEKRFRRLVNNFYFHLDNETKMLLDRIQPFLERQK